MFYYQKLEVNQFTLIKGLETSTNFGLFCETENGCVNRLIGSFLELLRLLLV
jgi:hypothetical protein